MSIPVEHPAPITPAAPPGPPVPPPVEAPTSAAGPSPWPDETYRGWSGL